VASDKKNLLRPTDVGIVPRTLTIPLTIASIAITAGCTSPATTRSAPETPHSPAASATQAADLTLGKPGQVTGEKGTTLTLIPLAVKWTKGAKELDPPANGWFLVVAIKVEATTGADTIAAPASGYGLYWRGQGATIDSSEGNTGATAWVGMVNELGAPIEPGNPETVIETYDVPAKGGRLIHISTDGTITAWRLPAGNAGDQRLFKRVDARIKEFGGERPI